MRSRPATDPPPTARTRRTGWTRSRRRTPSTCGCRALGPLLRMILEPCQGEDLRGGCRVAAGASGSGGGTGDCCEQAGEVLAARAAGAQVRGDARVTPLCRLGAVFDDGVDIDVQYLNR